MNIRIIELARAGWGLALLTAPRPMLTHLHRVRVDATSVAVARILGARHLAQAALSGVAPSPTILAVGVWVDTVHAATAVGLAVVDGERRRAGLTDAAVAASWAGFGLHDLRSAGSGTTHRGTRRDRLARVALRVLPCAGKLRSYT